MPLDDFIAEYRVARFAGEVPNDGRLLGVKRERRGCSALMRAEDLPAEGAEVSDATLEEIMVHLEKE